MTQTILLSDETYKKLASLASGFSTPSQVIEKLIDAYEKGINEPASNNANSNHIPNATPTRFGDNLSNNIDIIYFPNNSESQFKIEFLEKNIAYVKLFYANGEAKIKIWHRGLFTENSSVNGNLRSGYLRGWRDKGIYKAEVTTDQSNFSN